MYVLLFFFLKEVNMGITHFTLMAAVFVKEVIADGTTEKKKGE